MPIFSRQKLIAHKIRAHPNFSYFNFLFEKSSEILIERLQSIDRNMSRVVHYDNGETNILFNYIKENYDTQLYQVVALDSRLNLNADLTIQDELLSVEGDLELVLCNLNIHWINDLAKFLAQIYKFLKNRGIFFGTALGGSTLYELRKSIFMAQSDLGNEYTAHISPFINNQTAAQLLQSAGYEFVVSDLENIQVLYPDLITLIQDLRGMGETNNLNFPRLDWDRQFLNRVEHNYREKFSKENELVATFQIIILSGARFID